MFSLTLMSVCSSFLFGQTIQEKTEIVKDYNQQELVRLQQDFKTKSDESKKRALQLAAINGWPLTLVTTNGSFAELQGVDENDNPLYYVTSNVDAARSTRTNHLNSGGSLGLNLNGDNLTAYVWDGGVARASHQEYDGAGGTNRFSVGDGTTSLNYHAAHVTGTIMASGVQASAKGMAPYCNVIGNDWNSDLSEATSAAANGMLVSNHSYGYGIRNSAGQVQLPQYYFGGYIGVSRSWDQIMYNAPYYLMVVAAGNDGNDNTANTSPLGGNSLYDKLNGHATSKNNLVIANAQDANVDAAGNLISVSISSSSSEGPTDDLRIKPDLTGNGSGVYSTYESSNSAYGTISGTSMASPNVTGSLLLLQEHYNNTNGNYMRAATLKGLALHTADDAGSTGPDAVFGWGLMNSKRAAEAISTNGTASMVQELTLSSGQTYTITVNSDGINDLLASISWTDLPGTANTGTVNPSTRYIVNDLDIRVSKSGTTYTPWKLTGPASNTKGDNNVDPFERVDVANASGTYTITVTHKGSLSGGSQNYSLIITGIAQAVACNATVPSGLSASAVTASSASLSWNAVSGTTYDVRFKPTASSTWTTGSVASNAASLTGLTAGTQYEAQVRSVCPSSTSAYSSSVIFTTGSGSSFCTGAITSYPYNQGFENTIGTWTQDTGDDFNWALRSGGTPSSSTGPSSANEGSYYVYMESSAPNYSTKNAILTSPCFDLTAVSNPSIDFDYHLYGAAAMGSLSLQATTNGTSWTTIWSKSGNQGNAWVTESIDLSAYASSSAVKFRFNGTTGTTWQGDMAIDALSIKSAVPSCTDVNLSITFDNYPEETSWDIKNSSNVTVASGGTYASQADGSTLNIPLCLNSGCYTLTMYDAYGDGICCAYGNGSYTLTNSSTSVVLASGGSFASSQSTSFCVGSTGLSQFSETNEISSEGSRFEMYPNPVENVLFIDFNSTRNVSYEVLDMNGRILFKGALENSQIDFSPLSSGVYIMKVSDGNKTITQRVVKK